MSRTWCRPESVGVNREDRKGYSYNMLNSEAGRCMNCGCLAVNPSDMATALLASDAVIRTNLRTLGAQELLTSPYTHFRHPA